MGAQDILRSIEQEHLKTDVPPFHVGDTINVHCRIVEGDKERIQVFQGTLIGRRGGGINETIMVRRIVDGSGVERVFPLHSPRIAKYEIVRRADSRRAKLYFLRDRIGKKRRLRDRRRGMQHVAGETTVQG
jgi:large subunit ribosomal protein L19